MNHSHGQADQFSQFDLHILTFVGDLILLIG